jgi:hypothetical protein
VNSPLAPEEVTRLLHIVMDEASDLPLHDIEQIEDLIRAGERLVAFENLCTQLYEYDIRLTPYLRDILASVGTELMAVDRYWERLDLIE